MNDVRDALQRIMWCEDNDSPCPTCHELAKAALAALDSHSEGERGVVCPEDEEYEPSAEPREDNEAVASGSERWPVTLIRGPHASHWQEVPDADLVPHLQAAGYAVAEVAPAPLRGLTRAEALSLLNWTPNARPSDPVFMSARARLRRIAESSSLDSKEEG